jgi:hypothetical protein
VPLVDPAGEANSAADASMEEEQEEGGDDEGGVVKKTEPTHWKQLDPKSMKVSLLTSVAGPHHFYAAPAPNLL